MSSHLAKSSPHFQIACVISVTKSPLAGLGIAIEKMSSIIPPESLHSCSRSFYSPVSSLAPLKFSLKIDYCLLAGGTFCWVKAMALREWCGPVLPWINSTVFTRKSETFISIPSQAYGTRSSLEEAPGWSVCTLRSNGSRCWLNWRPIFSIFDVLTDPIHLDISLSSPLYLLCPEL